MRRLLLLPAAILSLSLAAPLLADGQAAFATPGASPVGTGKWQDPEGTGWTNWTAPGASGYCYTRASGIGLRGTDTGTSSVGIVRTFGSDAAEPVREIEVACTATTKSALAAAPLDLCVTLTFPDGTESSQTLGYTFPDSDPVSGIFRWPDARPVTAIRINSLAEPVFEVASVAWRADTLPITAAYGYPRVAYCGTDFRIHIGSLRGGSENYSLSVDAFGTRTDLRSVSANTTLTLRCPDTPGFRDLTLTVTDSDGKTRTDTLRTEIRPDYTPAPPRLSEVTGTSFRLTWDPFRGDAVKYVLHIEAPDRGIAAVPLPPPEQWTHADGWNSAVIDLSADAPGQRLNSVYLDLAAALPPDSPLPEWRFGNLPWTPAAVALTDTLIQLIAISKEAAPAQFRIRLPDTVPIPAGSLKADLRTAVSEHPEFPPGTHTARFDGFPRGIRLTVDLIAYGKPPKEGDPPHLYRADTLRVQLDPLPTFSNACLDPTGSFVRVLWPDGLRGDTGCTGTFTFVARLGSDTPAAPHPLRLTGLLYFKNPDDRRLHKLYAVTNTGSRPIDPREEDYRLTAVRSSGTDAGSWNFRPTASADDAGLRYTVAPGETLVFDAGKAPMPAHFADRPVARPGTPAALDCGSGAAVTLTCGGTPVGPTLTLTKDTLILCAPDGTVTQTPVTDAADAAPLFAPPPAPSGSDTLTLAVRTLTGSTPYTDIPFPPLLALAEQAAADRSRPLLGIFAEGFVSENGTPSATARFDLWAPTPHPPTPRGYLLRLR